MLIEGFLLSIPGNEMSLLKRFALTVLLSTSLLVFVETAWSQPLQEHTWKEVPAIGALFTQSAVQGTFVVLDSSKGTLIGANYQRAATRFSPASTFKIPNALIGLSVGAVKDVNELIPYRSNDPPFNPAWVRDMGLRDAILLSNVPIFQELARRVGLSRMQSALIQLQYGSIAIGSDVTRFWLDGPLMISALEQVSFLNRLAQGTLPLSDSVQQSVRDITLVEKRASYLLHAKTGWQHAPNQGIGWWVGWVKRADAVYPFALNLDIRTADDAALRQKIGLAALRMLQLID